MSHPLLPKDCQFEAHCVLKFMATLLVIYQFLLIEKEQQ
jgi:hypothetical protein